MSAEENIQQFQTELSRWVNEIWKLPDIPSKWGLYTAWDHCFPNQKMRDRGKPYAKTLILPRARKSIERLLERWNPDELSVILADVYAEYGINYTSRSDSDYISVIISIAWLINNPSDNLFEVLTPVFNYKRIKSLSRYRHLELIKNTKPNENILNGYIQILTGKTALCRYDISHHAPDLMYQLFLFDKLNYPIFRESVRLYPWCFETLFSQPESVADQRFVEQIRFFYRECINEFLTTSDPLLHSVIARVYGTTGPSECLFQALRLLEKNGRRIDRLDSMIRADKTRNAIMSLATIAEAPVDQETILERLKTHNPITLQGILPYARNYRALIAQALGYENGIELIHLLAQILGVDEIEYTSDFIDDKYPEISQINLQDFDMAISKAGGELTAIIIDIFYHALYLNNAAWILINALLDENRSEIIKKISRKNVSAIKAYGILPIINGVTEIQERYRRLMKIKAASNGIPVRHQVNQRAAVDFALAGLAQRAGYPNSDEFKTAMEAI